LGQNGGLHEKSAAKPALLRNNSGNLEVFLRLGIDKSGGSSKVDRAVREGDRNFRLGGGVLGLGQ
jgi:hypothetical protein